MKELIIQNLITILINSLPPDALLKASDKLLDALEDIVEKSETPIDDAIVFPLLQVIRTTFGIPDNDDVTQ